MTLKKGDFVQVEYKGYMKDSGELFDTTDKTLAEQEDIVDTTRTYGPMTVCLGEHFLIPALDDAMIGQEVNKEIEVDVPCEKGFGKKDAKLIQMIPMSKFKQHKIQPVPGLQLTIDDSLCVVKTVSGGRVLVDFNHILAGKDLVYKITPKKVVEDEAEKVKTFLRHLGLDGLEIESQDGKVTIKLHAEIPEEIKTEFTKKIQSVIPSIKEVNFSLDKKK